MLLVTQCQKLELLELRNVRFRLGRGCTLLELFPCIRTVSVLLEVQRHYSSCELVSAPLQHVQRLTLYLDITRPLSRSNEAAARGLTFTVMESSALRWLRVFGDPLLPVTLRLKKHVEVSDNWHVVLEWL